MDEQEWLQCTDPAPMLEFLRGKASDRKFRLWACACVRRIWQILTNDRYRRLLEITERIADGKVGEEALAAVDTYVEETDAQAAEPALVYLHSHTLCIPNHARPDGFPAAQVRAAVNAAWAQRAFAIPRARLASWYAGCLAAWKNEITQGSFYTPPAEIRANLQAERLAHCGLLSDLFGNPFRPVSFDPSWLTPTVKAIAQTIYTERTFTDLPVLADALEEAGCTNDDILNHCRGPNEHVRGCWVVDLILGKS